MSNYQILNVSPTASNEEIKIAFRKLALEKHPDKNPGSSKEDFQKIQQAWECLRDCRKSYDEDLQRESLRAKCKRESAMVVSIQEMEEVLDDETGDLLYCYSCRCGDEIYVLHEDVMHGNKSVIEDCPGCSLSYSIQR